MVIAMLAIIKISIANDIIDNILLCPRDCKIANYLSILSFKKTTIFISNKQPMKETIIEIIE